MKLPKAPLKKFKPKPKKDLGCDLYQETKVCTRCGILLKDAEPMSPQGEFIHRQRPGIACVNDNGWFHRDDPEIAPFQRKRNRRTLEITDSGTYVEKPKV